MSEKRLPLAPSIAGTALAPEGRDAMPGAPGAPIRTRLLRSPTNRPARVAQSSAQRVDEAEAGRAPRGPRFARFAAAMAAAPASQDQLCAQSQRRIRPAATVNTSSRIQWLGIGSWGLFCAALFVTLLLRPDRDAVDHGIALQEAEHTLRRAIVSVPATADPMPLLLNRTYCVLAPQQLLTTLLRLSLGNAARIGTRPQLCEDCQSSLRASGKRWQ